MAGDTTNAPRATSPDPLHAGVEFDGMLLRTRSFDPGNRAAEAQQRLNNQDHHQSNTRCRNTMQTRGIS